MIVDYFWYEKWSNDGFMVFEYAFREFMRGRWPRLACF